MQTTSPEPTEAVKTEQPKRNVIVKLVSKNYKRLRAIEIVPNHRVITLTGQNEAGKSSVLQAILAVIAGQICPRPIRDGETKSETEIEFGDFTATLKITPSSGAKLTVRSNTGMPISSPRSFLEQHSNPILLDILGFIRKAETADGRREQAELLRKLVGLDFTALDQEHAQKYQERTGVNRDLDNAKGRLGNYPVDLSVPDVEVSIAGLVKELQVLSDKGDRELVAAQEHNRQNQRVKDEWETASKRFSSTEEDIATVDTEIAELEKKLQGLKADRVVLVNSNKSQAELLAKCEKAVATLVYKDEKAIRDAQIEARKPLQKRMEQADETNTRVRGNQRRKEIAEEIAIHQKKSDSLTYQLAEIVAEKQTKLSKTKFPYPGLTFGEDGILLNNLPFTEEQCSQAQLCKAAVAIGFAFKPRIPVVLIKDAAILSKASMEAIAEMADKEEGQVWMECIESEDPHALEIVDGEIKE